MGNTKIEWAEKVWNPVRGCSPVSPGCKHCYAERMCSRGLQNLKSPTTGENFAHETPFGPLWTGRVELIESQLEIPLHWRKPRRIFVNSMSDLFHEALPDNAIDRVFALMALCPQHTFMVLTKRAKRMREWFGGVTGERFRDAVLALMIARPVGVGPLPNVWLGVSTEDQKTAAERLPLLLQTPAALRFVSYEPALGPVDFSRWMRLTKDSFGIPYPGPDPRLTWVIAGGESGPGARPAHPDWFRAVRDQCQASGVPFFLKQMHFDGKLVKMPMLDGHAWDQIPEVR